MKSKVLILLSLVSLAIFISGFSIFSTSCQQVNSMNPPIEYDSFDRDWKKVDSLINKGLPQSALELVDGIYAKSKETQNHPQFIKATLYRIKLNADFEENFIEKTIVDLNQEIKQSQAPLTQLLHSIEADLLWRYYQANRYKFLDRTAISNINSDDMQSWDLNHLLDVIIKHYHASLSNAEELKQTDLQSYEAILLTEKNSKKYRPTLYDFLAHRAVDFFMHQEAGLTKPAESFHLNKEEYFLSASRFSNLKIETSDSLSLKFYATKIFQELLDFHANDIDATALTDANLKRLNFIHQYSNLEIKDSLYLEALLHIEEEVSSLPISTDASYQIAKLYQQLGQNYKPLESEKNRWEIKKAVEVCDAANNRFPESAGAKNCENLKATIQLPILNIETEKINLPNQPSLGLLSYKNVSRLHCRLIKIGFEENRALSQANNEKEKLIDAYRNMPAEKYFAIDLPDEGDFQNHSLEFRIPELPNGHYILLAGTSDQFVTEKDAIAYGSFTISEISYINRSSADGTYEFFMLHRETGQALKGVKAQLVHRIYDYRSREYTYEKDDIFESDESGHIRLPEMKDASQRNSFYMEFTYKNDQLITDDQFYNPGYYQPSERKTNKTWFFTDRAIYRPGQTVYFKGIVLENYKDENEIKADFSTEVELFDVNYQKVSSLKLTSNEFGSFHGSFTIPTGVLTGNMTIRNKSGAINIKVEEYKRPKFEVTFEPVEGSYKLNEEVSVKGIAKAYAGNNIDNAQVSYRVVRKVRFPFWRYFWYPQIASSPEVEILNGTTSTDETGSFEISFKAIPDLSVNTSQKPTFNYEVIADVTDINGETQSSTNVVSVGYTALLVDLTIGMEVEKSSFSQFKIKTTNLNGQAEKASGKISISKVKERERLLTYRFWNEPDQFIMNEETFKKDFPNTPYKNEYDFLNRALENPIAIIDFNTENDSVIELADIDGWESGRYKVVVKTTDAFGQDVNHEQFFLLYSEADKKAPVNEIGWFKIPNKAVEPGETIKVLLGSQSANVNVLFELNKEKEIIDQQWVSLNKEQKSINIPITESMRGGVNINLIFVKHNRAFETSMSVMVPFTNKELDFEFETFRNKLEPGQEEEWKIKIKGKNGDAIAAELLASMYDASLDAFVDHSWAFRLFSQRYGSSYWQSNNAFNTSRFYWTYKRPITTFVPLKSYDQLNWFGFNYVGGYYGDFMEMGIEAKVSGVYSADGEMGGVRGARSDQSDMYIDGMRVKGENLEEVLIDHDTGPIDEDEQEEKPTGLQVRRDFHETAFFYPDLQTNEKGEVIIKFSTPESLTRWNLMGLAHTKDLSSGQFQKEIVTQKDLMVVPNVPRFFREGDKMTFSSKVVNMSEETLSGEAQLVFMDARTMQDISALLQLNTIQSAFKTEKGSSAEVSWEIQIPEGIDVITYRISATVGNFTDGEEMAIPVLSNRMLVTESLPLPINGNETKSYKLDKLVNSGGSKKSGSTLRNHKLTLEFSSNPTWYAIQALPYVMETKYESADHIFNRYYANSIASHLVNSKPNIKQVFDNWKNFTPDALLSNLEKNEELKSLILQETPWVMDAKNETERKQRVALLFDLNNMSNELSASLRMLKQKQSPNGGWPWYKGMRESRYITQRIVLGFGHLKNMGISEAWEQTENRKMINAAIRFLDQEIKEDYDYLKEHHAESMDEMHINNTQIQYLYARSFFMKDIPVSKSQEEAFTYYREQAKTYWLKQSKYLQAMIALSMQRLGVKSLPSEIMTSIREHALYKEEMGMYWKDNNGGYYWYQAPIETQALFIEAFDEITSDKKAVEQMKTWLLKQKQTQDWKTAKATAEAVYALILTGSDWLDNTELAEIQIGGEKIDPFALEETKVEAGTGYFKTSWSGSDIEPKMGNITITNKNDNPAWGAIYWQYFENLDRITSHETPLQLSKALFIEKNTKSGPVLEAVEEGSTFQIGDKVKVRIELRVDRNMEFVHMKDMRASAFEPINVLSAYRYQGGLGYYESTKDASVNFFFESLQKGTYVFEYPLVVSQKGEFYNGITTIQCMYAPEFSSHSEGLSVIVD
jgi:hypothetical protein